MVKWMVELHLGTEHKEEVKKDETKGKVIRAEKVRRPEVGSEMTNEKWAFFISRWTDYKGACGLKGNDLLVQLRECMGENVREDHLNRFAGCEAKTEVELLA